MPSPDYQPAAVIGDEWTRTYQIVIDNRLGAAPAVSFFEERALLVADSAPRHWAIGHCHLPYDEAVALPILDPATGADTGASITLADFYGLVYSAYRYAAAQRDTAGQPVPVEE